MDVKVLIKILTIGLYGFVLLGFYYQHDMGLANQDDFLRSASFITSGPIISDSCISANNKTVSWKSYYYMPFWQLRWDADARDLLFSSTIFLWLPGIVLNYFLVSPTILWLPSLSLIPKLLSLVFLWLFITWVEKYPKYSLALLLTSGIPLVLILTNTAYLSYWNSFFLETGGFIYLLMYISGLVSFVEKPGAKRLLMNLFILFLLSTAKPAYLYWLVLGVPYLFFLWYRILKKYVYVFLTGGVIVTLLMTFFASKIVINPLYVKYNAYNSIFLGILKFSKNHESLLEKSGIPEASSCVNVSPFWVPEGVECFYKFNSLTFWTAVKMIASDPSVIFREISFAMAQMQDITVDYLGRYPINDPRFPQQERLRAANERAFAPYEREFLNTWGYVKYHYFPRGKHLFIFLVVSCLGYATVFFKSVAILNRAISSVGFLASFFCVIDIVLSILTGGVIELVKHLFMANLLFDISLLAFLMLVTILIIDLLHNKVYQSFLLKMVNKLYPLTIRRSVLE